MVLSGIFPLTDSIQISKQWHRNWHSKWVLGVGFCKELWLRVFVLLLKKPICALRQRLRTFCEGWRKMVEALASLPQLAKVRDLHQETPPSHARRSGRTHNDNNNNKQSIPPNCDSTTATYVPMTKFGTSNAKGFARFAHWFTILFKWSPLNGWSSASANAKRKWKRCGSKQIQFKSSKQMLTSKCFCLCR